jgi:hypothetical protein
MRVYLDLLPDERKEEIKKGRILRQIIHQEGIFLFPIFAFIIILITINFSLKINLESISDNSQSKSYQESYKELQSYEDKFSSINSKVSEILKIQNNHLNWLGIFKRLNEKMVENVYLSDLVTVDYQVSLSGKAKTRDDFLKFQDSIKGEECFSNVDVPLSSLVSKEDVQFQIDFEIKEECLKNKEL